MLSGVNVSPGNMMTFAGDILDGQGWSFGFEYSADRSTYNAQYPPTLSSRPTGIPEPRTIMLFIFGIALLVLSRTEPAPTRTEVK